MESELAEALSGMASDEVEVSCASHPGNLLLSLTKLKCNGILCDVTIKSGEFEVKAHKAVLASATEYFRAMFTNETKEAVIGIVDFSNIAPEIVRNCIEFIYSGKVKISKKTVKDLMEFSELVQLTKLSGLCVCFLAERIDLRSCSDSIYLSYLYGVDSLNPPLRAFLVEHFKEFAKTEAFMAFDFKSVSHCIGLLRDQSPEIELQIWNGILAWTLHDEEERKGYFEILFASIELSFFSKTFLHENILSHSFVNDSMVCLRKVARFNAIQQITDFPEASHATDLKCCFVSQDSSQAIVQYDVKLEKWSFVVFFSRRLNNHTHVLWHKGNVYVGDGCSIHKFRNGMWSRTLLNSKSEKTSTCYNRCVGIGNSLFMVTSKCVYEYAIAESTLVLYEMGFEFSGEFFTIASSSKVYIMSSNCTDRKAAAFDTVTKRCARICDMRNVWDFGCAAWFQGNIYTFCRRYRCSDDSYIRSVECYNPSMDSWGVVEGLYISEKTLGVYISDKIYLFCRESDKICQTIELDRLKTSKMDMRMGLCSIATV